ncbi:MAG: undecaprenyldiphospho-muramoylpentapeptide beta-N-acetylglucosaminyltransferase [Sedimentisphaerales bacterium]|nr:undecaprenyldiphospho-muramoylpentapeptide beta-N-acetylglucosaminyltransferase [Sedimentisphaerales bacterium]
MGQKDFYFAGGGTGGHIYPAIAVAEQIKKSEPKAKIHFFCSNRKIDSEILSKTGFDYTVLSARRFSFRPVVFFQFCISYIKSSVAAFNIISKAKKAVVIGVGGYVAAPVCLAAKRLKMPIVLLNVDSVPGRANRLLSHWAKEIFLQFDETAKYFVNRRANISVVGCPLRSEFKAPEPDKVKQELGLDDEKKILLITGASSGSRNINEAICALLIKLEQFANDWQIVHLTGHDNFEEVSKKYEDARIKHKLLKYCDEMASLLAAADLVIGRSGAVSVAEFAAAGCPSICMPYPYHKDMHQYLNAGKLVDAQAAVIVDDVPDSKERAEWLWEELEELMRNDKKRKEMAENYAKIGHRDAAARITTRLLESY